MRNRKRGTWQKPVLPCDYRHRPVTDYIRRCPGLNPPPQFRGLTLYPFLSDTQTPHLHSERDENNIQLSISSSLEGSQSLTGMEERKYCDTIDRIWAVEEMDAPIPVFQDTEPHSMMNKRNYAYRCEHLVESLAKVANAGNQRQANSDKEKGQERRPDGVETKESETPLPPLDDAPLATSSDQNVKERKRSREQKDESEVSVAPSLSSFSVPTCISSQPDQPIQHFVSVAMLSREKEVNAVLMLRQPIRDVALVQREMLYFLPTEKVKEVPVQEGLGASGINSVPPLSSQELKAYGMQILEDFVGITFEQSQHWRYLPLAEMRYRCNVKLTVVLVCNPSKKKKKNTAFHSDARKFSRRTIVKREVESEEDESDDSSEDLNQDLVRHRNEGGSAKKVKGGDDEVKKKEVEEATAIGLPTAVKVPYVPYGDALSVCLIPFRQNTRSTMSIPWTMLRRDRSEGAAAQSSTTPSSQRRGTVSYESPRTSFVDPDNYELAHVARVRRRHLHCEAVLAYNLMAERYRRILLLEIIELLVRHVEHITGMYFLKTADGDKRIWFNKNESCVAPERLVDLIPSNLVDKVKLWIGQKTLVQEAYTSNFSAFTKAELPFIQRKLLISLNDLRCEFLGAHIQVSAQESNQFYSLAVTKTRLLMREFQGQVSEEGVLRMFVSVGLSQSQATFLVLLLRDGSVDSTQILLESSAAATLSTDGPSEGAGGIAGSSDFGALFAPKEPNAAALHSDDENPFNMDAVS